MKPRKRNIVEGVAHMGTYFNVMPEIAAYIGADYNEDDLDQAYQKFINTPEPEEDIPYHDDEARKGIYWDHWILQGKELRFIIQFEKGKDIISGLFVARMKKPIFR